MFSRKSLASLALAAFLFTSPSVAAPRITTRDSAADASFNAASAIPLGTDAPSLEPVIPPSTDEESLALLNLDSKVELAWAGTPAAGPSSSTRRVRRDDSSVLTTITYDFKHPSIPLDHSAFVSNVACSAGKLSGTLTAAAYEFAKKEWAGAEKILFITSVDGCGNDAENELFLAGGVTFSDDGKTFATQGEVTTYSDVAEHISVKLGVPPAAGVKRAMDKRSMFEEHSHERRWTATGHIDWNILLSDPKLLGTAPSAPWKNAALLAEFPLAGGAPDDSWKVGEALDPAGQSSVIPATNITARDGLDAGLNMYCVDCGMTGAFTAIGTVDYSIFHGLERASLELKGGMTAGMYLGLESYVKYSQKREHEFAREYLNPWKIPLAVEFGPYIAMGVEASADISATGQMLVGAAAVWDNIDINVNLKDSSKSVANGFTPRFEHKAEAKGQLKVDAELGFPVSLGVGVTLFKFWNGGIELKDTPSINLNGAFEAEGHVDDNGHVVGSINGGTDACYGVDWNVHFENKLQADVKGDKIGSKSFDLIKPLKSDPIAQGCIGYKKPTVVVPSVPTNGTAAAAGNGTHTGRDGTCHPRAIRNPQSVSTDSICRRTGTGILNPGIALGAPVNRPSRNSCAKRCLLHAKHCQSFSYSPDNDECIMYGASVGELDILGAGAGSLVFADRDCFELTGCPQA